jgi:hypothetical protein
MVKNVFLPVILITLLHFLPADAQTTNNAIFLNNSTLSGNNGFVYLGAPDYQFTDKITISMWVKWNVDPNTYANLNEKYKWGNLITMDRVDYPYQDNGMFWFQHSSDNRKFEWALKSVTGRTYIQSNTSPQKDKWYFLTGVYDGSASDTTMKLYVNGVLENFALRSAISGNIVSMSNNFRLNIGRIADGYRLFPGYIDELRMWKRALTTDEINQQMYSKATINSASLSSYYDFDQTTGSVLTDKGPFGNNGKFYNQFIQVNSMSGSPVISVTDTTKSWTTNSLINKTVKIVSGTGLDASYVIASNTSNTITLTTPFSVTPTLSGSNNMTLIGVEASPSETSPWLISTAPLNVSNLNDYFDIKGVWNANITNSSSIINMSNTNVSVDEYLLFGNNADALVFSGYDVPDSVNGRLSRVWKFQTNKAGGVTGKISINFANLGVNDIAKLRILVSQNGTFSTATRLTGTVTGTTVSVNNILITDNTFITLGSKESTLPVELISFSSDIKDRNVTLRWKTSKEINNKGFQVERTTDRNSNNWENIGFVKGKGNSNEANNYVYTDSKLSAGKYCYRIKQEDYNGVYEYFNLSSVVEIKTPEKFSLSQNYPNPFNPATKIEFQISGQANVSLTVSDITGKTIATLVNKNLQAGFYQVDFNGSSLSSGTYFYTLKAGDNVSVKKMVLVK